MKRWMAGAAVVVAACAPAGLPTAAPTDAPDVSTPPSAVATHGGSQAAGTAVPGALDWSVAQLGGGQIDGGDLAGKDVVLWFWAPW